MGVLTDLVVAPRDDGQAVASTGSRERTWPWKDVKGLGVDDLAVMHCLLDGHDPDAPVSPPEWQVNPFTKERVAATSLVRYLEAFELAGEDGDAVALRVPHELVEALARLTSRESGDLARRWSSAKSAQTYGDGTPVDAFPEDAAAAYLADVATLARTAVELRHELFVWMSP